MTDNWGIGLVIGALVLMLLVNAMIHFGAYALLERSGWYHAPHHDEDGTCACDLDDVREQRRTSGRRSSHRAGPLAARRDVLRHNRLVILHGMNHHVGRAYSMDEVSIHGIRRK